MAIKLKNFLELYVPKAGDERKFVAKHVVKKTKDANKNDDKLFTGSNIKPINRETEHGYNPGSDEKVYEEVEQLSEMDVRTARELATKSRNEGKPKKAAVYEKVATALERGDQTTAQGFMQELKKIDEATLSTGEMKKREDYVKGMKKNMKSFTSKYGKDAKSVMYGAATNMAKEEVESIEELSKKTLGSYIKVAAQDTERSGRDQEHYGDQSDYDRGTKRQKGIAKAVDKLTKEETELDEGLFDNMPNTQAGFAYKDKKRSQRQAEHEKQDPKMAVHYAKNMVDTQKAAKKANERGIKKDPEDFGWKVRNGVQRGSLPEEVEQLNEYGDEWDTKSEKKAHFIAREKSAEHGTTMHISKYDDGAGYNVSAHKASGDSHVGTYTKGKQVDESRGHKIIATKLANMERMKNVEIPAAADRKKDKNNAKGAFKDMFGGNSNDLMSKLKIKEDLDGTLLGLYLDLDEENQQDMLEMIDAGNKEELIAFAATLKDIE